MIEDKDKIISSMSDTQKTFEQLICAKDTIIGNQKELIANNKNIAEIPTNASVTQMELSRLKID